MTLRSKIGAIGAGFYLLIFLCACTYPLFDKRTFSGLVPVLLAWPWIDYLPSRILFVMVGLNAIIIFFALAILSLLMSSSFDLARKTRQHDRRALKKKLSPQVGPPQTGSSAGWIGMPVNVDIMRASMKSC